MALSCCCWAVSPAGSGCPSHSRGQLMTEALQQVYTGMLYVQCGLQVVQVAWCNTLVQLSGGVQYRWRVQYRRQQSRHAPAPISSHLPARSLCHARILRVPSHSCMEALLGTGALCNGSGPHLPLQVVCSCSLLGTPCPSCRMHAERHVGSKALSRTPHYNILHFCNRDCN